MSTKLLIPSLLAMAALLFSSSTHAQSPAGKKMVTAAERSAANIYNDSEETNTLSKEAATAILNYEINRANKTEAQLKIEQLKLMKTFCTHHPTYQTASPGVSKASIVAVDTWKIKYPAEYAAYLQIFHFIQ